MRRVRERGRVRIYEARVAAARVVLAMGEARETVAGCGRRLGVETEKVKELRRLGREAAAGAGAGEATAEEGGEVGGVRGPEEATVANELGAEQWQGAQGAGPAAGGSAERVAGPEPGVAPVAPRCLRRLP